MALSLPALVGCKGLPGVSISDFPRQRSKLGWDAHSCWPSTELGGKGERREGARGQLAVSEIGKLKSTVGQHGLPGEQRSSRSS